MAKKRAAAYYRMSTDDQKGSIPEQRRNVERYAKANGYEIVGEYTDDGISASKKKVSRPGFDRMVLAAKGGEFEVLLIDDLDRLSRKDAAETIATLHQLREFGVMVDSRTDGPIDLNDSERMTWLLTGIKATGNHAFSLKLARRTAEARETFIREGKGTGGLIPYGYDRIVFNRAGEPLRRVRFGERYRRSRVEGEWTKLVPSDDPAKVEAVRWMFRTYAETGIGLREIVKGLIERGVPTAGKGCWWPSVVRRILRNRAYVGELRYGDRPRGEFRPMSEPIVQPDAHEPLIDPATFDKVQARLDQQKGQTNSWLKKNGNGFVLSGMIYCGACGRRMTGTTLPTPAGRTPIYRCCTSNNGGRCNYNGIRQAPLVRLLVRSLREAVLGGGYDALVERVEKRLREKHNADPAARLALKAKLDQMEAACRTLAKRMATAPEEIYADLERELADLRRQHQRAAAELLELERAAPMIDVPAEARKIAARLLVLESELDTADPVKLRELFRRMVYRITAHFGEEKRGKRTFYPFRDGLIELRPDAILLSLDPAITMSASPGGRACRLPFTPREESSPCSASRSCCRPRWPSSWPPSPPPPRRKARRSCRSTART